MELRQNAIDILPNLYYRDPMARPRDKGWLLQLSETYAYQTMVLDKYRVL